MPIDRDEHRVVGTCGVCGGPVVIYTGPWQSRERVCRHCGVSPTAPHIDKCQCPDCEPSKYPRKACDRGAFSPTERDALRESLRAALLRESQEKAWRLAVEVRAEKAEGERDVSEAVVDSLAQQWAALKVWLRDPENRIEYPEWADGVLDQMEHPEGQ